MSGPTGASRLDRSDGGVPRSEPGAPWWAYERPASTSDRPPVVIPGAAPLAPLPLDDDGVELPASTSTGAGTSTGARAGAGVPGAVTGFSLIVATAIGAQAGLDHLGVVLFPLAGLSFALAFAQRCRWRRPDEPWLPRLIILGALFKIVACTTRYVTFAEFYNQVGDAYVYDREGRELVAFWTGERSTDPMGNLPLTGSGLIRWLTGVLYYIFGRDLLAGFLLFGLLAVIGSYFWYRALADAVPYVDKKLFLIFIMFVPSIVFWPAALGKEALMQVALGAMAWATSLVLRGRFAPAVPLAVGGGMVLYLIRPHLLALATVAAAVPYFVGHLRGDGLKSFTSRPIGMIILGVLVIFTVTAGTKFVGVENLSLDSVEEQLDAQTESTSYGGSTYQHGGNSLTNPLFVPTGVVTVLFRPFLWESRSPLQMLAAAESALLLALVVFRFDSVKLAFRRCRLEPFILYCLMLLLFYSAAFSSLANFGLLTRQRSLVLPALFAIIAIDPGVFRRLIGNRPGPDNQPLVSEAALPLAGPAAALVPTNGNGHTNGNGNGVRNGNGNGNGNGRDRSAPTTGPRLDRPGPAGGDPSPQ